MVREAVLATVACVLFVQMGLSEAIQEILRIRLSVASCPKCVTMWGCLVVLLVDGHGLLESVAASFVSAYAAVWLSLAYDGLAVLYNRIYESFTPKPGTPEVAEARTDEDEAVGADEVPEM